MVLKLISNAKQSWRLWSQQAFAAVVAIQGVWLTLTPEQQLLMPDNMVNVATLVAAVVGVVSRLLVQKGKK